MFQRITFQSKPEQNKSDPHPTPISLSQNQEEKAVHEPSPSQPDPKENDPIPITHRGTQKSQRSQTPKRTTEESKKNRFRKRFGIKMTCAKRVVNARPEEKKVSACASQMRSHNAPSVVCKERKEKTSRSLG
ncbi:hypothetical protein DL98DRAFT_83646 [Cadophora sp. DSE1049]|nr:hypothetical protein DL98DRAFT_83646 [Cadophora sp. DSE1049]